MLHHLRAQTGQARPDLLIVAGAGHLGKEALETLAGHARRARVRLVYLLEHLRGDVAHVLGGADSAAVFMRLGNAEEATAAATHIGRGHKFVLSQLTEGIGRTLTEGTGDSRGGSESEGVTSGQGESVTSGESSSRNWGGWFSPSNSTSTGTSSSRTDSRSSSRTMTRGTTWQQTKNWSTADATNRGLTNSRVYEYTVEPTTLQSLPPTAFILVDTGPAGRRVASGDCNPGISTNIGGADNPREIASNLMPTSPQPTPDRSASPTQPRPTDEEPPALSVRINDPQESHRRVAETLRHAGYEVR